jgi:hypothetical protein
MPPQQSDRLLDLGDNGFDFGAHWSGIRFQELRDQDQPSDRRYGFFPVGNQIVAPVIPEHLIPDT